jgi:hypothetical protein
MTRPDRPPPLPDVPDSTVSELHALYREGAGAEPGPVLDRNILDAARAELRTAGALKSKRTAPRWKRWLAVTSTLAVGVLGLSLTWRVVDQDERDLRQTINAAKPSRDDADKAAKQSLPGAVAEHAAKAAVGAAPGSSPARQDAAANEGGAASPAPRAPAPTAPPPPAAARQSLERSKRADLDAPAKMRDASKAGDSAAAVASSADKREAEAEAGDDAATPEAWLKHIRELRAAGRHAEAAQSLARFRARYPDSVVPDDLTGPK